MDIFLSKHPLFAYTSTSNPMCTSRNLVHKATLQFVDMASVVHFQCVVEHFFHLKIKLQRRVKLETVSIFLKMTVQCFVLLSEGCF